jgi:ADP-ribosylglycohydrolase
MLREALSAARPALSPKHWQELTDWVKRSERLDRLELDGRDARGYTFKALGCSLWALRALFRARRKSESVSPTALFQRTLTSLVMEGGDADTNAAIAGALLGAAIGYSQLPGEWLDALPHHDWLLREVDAWIRSGAVDLA